LAWEATPTVWTGFDASAPDRPQSRTPSGIEVDRGALTKRNGSNAGWDRLGEDWVWLADRLLRFGEHYRQIARPFDWTFTRADLERVLAKITEREPRLALAA
jgi:hypothetical protein